MRTVWQPGAVEGKGAPLDDESWQAAWQRCWSGPPPKPSSSEESVAAALDCLMTGLPKVGYNHRFKPAGPTAEGMTRLREWAFDNVNIGDPTEAISEGTWALPPDRLTSKRKGCSPDWVIIWTDAILIVEFKTKAGSMTLGQVEEQLTVLRHHHPTMPLLHLYVTPVPAMFQPTLQPMMKYRNVSWSEFVTPLITPFGAIPDAVALSRFVAAADAVTWWQ